VILLTGNPLEQLEREGFDRALRARARLGWTPPSDRRIAILGIDDADMAALPDLAAEYQAVAAAISQASDLGAAVIVLDVIYARGTPEMARPILAAVENGAPVVFAEAWLTIPDARAAARRLRSFPFRSEPVEPAGLINIDVDADGVHRSYALLRQGARDWEPSLALAAYFVSRGIDWKNEIHQPRPGVIQWVENSAGRSAPTENGLVEDSRAARLLNFRGSWSAGAGFYHLNLRMLRELHGASAAMGSQPLAGKIIFLTNTTTGVADLGTTSFGPNQPQVLLHATALNDLLEDAPMRRTGRSSDALALLAVPVLVGVCGGRRHKRWLLLLWAMGCASIVSIGLALIFRFGWVPATVTTATLWTVAMVVELGRRHTLELAGRQRLRSTMGLYFSPRVLRDVLENPGRLEPKRVEITVLLTDLRNSTPLAELFGADHMLELLNRVFAVQTRAVFGEEGSLERPVGDQFLAYWGAPEPQPDAADRAMRAAFALVRGMRQLKETLELQVRELFGYGVALHAGSSLIGNIGSDQFFHYGLVGDLINAAARVESLTKYYGVLLIVTREFHDKLNAPPPVRTLDRVIVKGRTTVLDLLEVRHPFSPENFAEVAKRYGEAFALYQRGSFAEAACLFSALAPDDPPSRVLAARCTMFAGQAPGEWAGIFKMETK
jgi:adenylate cyclase